MGNNNSNVVQFIELLHRTEGEYLTLFTLGRLC